MAKKKEIWSSGVHYHKAVLAGNNICDTSMKNCHIKASDFSPKFQPGLVATTRPQGWHRMGPGFVRWPCVCDLKCECGRSGIFNVISCDAVNYGCQLSTVNHCQLSSAQIGVNSQRGPANSCHVQPCPFCTAQFASFGEKCLYCSFPTHRNGAQGIKPAAGGLAHTGKNGPHQKLSFLKGAGCCTGRSGVAQAPAL